MTLRVKAVSRLVIVTLAPGTAALVASVTWPTMALVVSPCAHPAEGKRTNAPVIRRLKTATRRIFLKPPTEVVFECCQPPTKALKSDFTMAILHIVNYS